MKINKINFNILYSPKKEEKLDNKNFSSDFSTNNFLQKSYPKNYYINSLSFKGNDFREKLISQIEKDENELFLFLYEELEKKLTDKSSNTQVTEETIENNIVNIFLLVKDYKNSIISKDTLIEKIDEIYETIKPQSQDYVSKYGELSINKEVEGKKAIINLLTDEHKNKMGYLVQPDEKEVQKQKTKLQEVLSKTNLDKREKDVLLAKYGQNKEIISEKYGLTKQRKSLIAKRALLKTQIANQITPEDIKKKISEISTLLSVDYEDVEKIAQKEPYILNYSKEEILNRINTVTEEFKDEELTFSEYSKCILKNPAIIQMLPKTVIDNIKGIVKRFEQEGLTTKDYIKACKKQPTLFHRSPDRIENNVRELVKRFEQEGLTVNDYLKACLKAPALLTLSPDKIEDNVRKLVKQLKNKNLTVEDYLKVCLKSPSLFAQNPDTIAEHIHILMFNYPNNNINNKEFYEIMAAIAIDLTFSTESLLTKYTHSKAKANNVKRTVKKFEQEGLTVNDYLEASKKRSDLLYRSPDTIESRVRNLVKKFEQEGLTVNDYLKACKKQPRLFYQSPDTVEKNVKDLVKKFEQEGLTLKGYIESCKKQPPLFYQSPDTVEKNVKDLVKKFEQEGLTLKGYIESCKKQPSLFCISPDTVESNVRGLVKKFEQEDLTINDYLKACIKQPSLFHQSPDTIESNVRNLVKKFEQEDLTINDYLKACIKQPPLFCISPDTVEKNVKDLIKKFEQDGLTLKGYIESCKKHPPLFCLLPDTVAEHIDIIRFCNFNNGKQIDTDTFWNKILKSTVKLTYSTSLLLIGRLIIPKMFENTTIPEELKGDGLKTKLNKYLTENETKKPKQKYIIKVKNIKSNTDCIKVLNETLKNISMNALGREDVFEVIFE